uniref:mpv17-like protein isoform X1 n=1 Tax=Doryrhamphus excisus TaxID=161450 RepID=UPI0025ADE353|nr:mpv17-like protein isoform X1 [Doryrhamphus excisus]
MRRAVLREAAKRFPWLANVTLYGCLFAGGDLAHQLMAHKERLDWQHTRNVAVVAITFHGNFNYFWMRALERRFPGKSAGMLFRKLLLDQSFASPLATSVFYTGVSFLEGKEDIFEDWREKFFNTWKTGLMYWPFMQVSPYLSVHVCGVRSLCRPAYSLGLLGHVTVINDANKCVSTVPKLCADATAHAHGLHGLLRLPVGHLPVLLTPGW